MKGLHHTTYESKNAPTWCPGCGNFAIWKSLHRALAELSIAPHNVLMVYGVGCSGNMANTVYAYGFHGLHGRAVPVAVGAKLANSNLSVIIAGGDGDGYGEGLNHLIHALRGNVDITYIVHNNSVYGLTTGQASPTSHKGFKAKSTPHGLIEEPLNPLALAISAGGTFVARGFAGDSDHLVSLIKAAIKHPGFALLDVFQPCVTFNKTNTYGFYDSRTYKLQDDPAYTARDREAAYRRAIEVEKLPTGIFLQDTSRPHYQEELVYLKGRPLVSRVEHRQMQTLYKEFI